MKITKNFKFVFVLALLIITLTVITVSAKGFVHAPVIMVDGEEYFMAGAPDGPGGATDIPGYEWVQADPNQVSGKHYNTGPFGKAQWSSSDAPNGDLLYVVQGIIDTWSLEKAASYLSRGYNHYHELLSVADGSEHSTKVVWLKHTAAASFNLDGGPHPELGHEVTPGIDLDFILNGLMPYNP
jgi:selenium-binding protein 1